MASLPANQRDPYHVAVAVQDFLYRTGGFLYDTDVRGLCQDTSKLVDCFLQTKRGYCEHFATAMVMLLREMGIPSRYVLGYLPGREQDDGSWTVDRSAAHAWVEVYFPGHGWIEFDPTPGNAENGQEPTHLAAGPEQAPPPSIGPVGGRGELECADRIDCQSAAPAGPIVSSPDTPAAADNGLTSAVAVFLVVLSLLLLAIVAVLRRIPSAEPEIAYRGVTRLATRLGYGPRPAQTAYEFAARLGELVPVASADLHLIATAKVEATYGRRQPADSMRRTLGVAYRRVRLGLLRLMMRRPKLGLRPRSARSKRQPPS
jgi:hypothetical protein